MRRYTTVLLLFLVLAGCTTTSRPPDAPRATLPESAPSPAVKNPEAAPVPARQPETLPTVSVPARDRYPHLASLVNDTLPQGVRIVSVEDSPAMVAGSPGGSNTVVLIGLASDDSRLLIWNAVLVRPDTVELRDFETIGPVRTVRHFTRLEIGPSGPTGFTASLVQEEKEEFLLGLLSENRPYVVVAPQSTGTLTEIRDADNDGVLELVQYSQLYEAPANREVVMDIFEWCDGSFASDTTVLLLRSVNQFLSRAEEALRDRDDELLQQLMAKAVTVEGPPIEDLLPATEVTAPRFQELPFDVRSQPWAFTYEFLLRRDGQTGVYQITIEFPDNLSSAQSLIVRE